MDLVKSEVKLESENGLAAKLKDELDLKNTILAAKEVQIEGLKGQVELLKMQLEGYRMRDIQNSVVTPTISNTIFPKPWEPTIDTAKEAVSVTSEVVSTQKVAENPIEKNLTRMLEARMIRLNKRKE
jgi:hypothetical protein